MSTELQELRSDVDQHHTVLFGVEGQGGLIREVQNVKESVKEQEKKLNAVSIKWLVIMLLAGTAGNSLGTSLLHTLHLLP